MHHLSHRAGQGTLRLALLWLGCDGAFELGDLVRLK